MWKDLALPAARAQLAGTGEAATTAEMHAVWEQLAPEVRDELCSFAQAKSHEETSSIAKKESAAGLRETAICPE